MTDSYIFDAVRTKTGKYAGGLADVRPDDLAAGVIRSLLERNPSVDPAAIDDVFLGGAGSQRRTGEHLEGLEVLWVGVRCAPEVATAREQARGDRTTGMAAAQADVVHRGVVYDVVVDTGCASVDECARLIAARVI